MSEQKITGLEESVSKIRDRILTNCLLKKLDVAENALDELKEITMRADVSDVLHKELECRYLESELDVAEIREHPIRELASVLSRINESVAFSSSRKSEVTLRGLTKITSVLSDSEGTNRQI